ncbi:uncharacterized protein LOC127639463 [Xyrauchen texanus]|uniref:uncharacterized protein LOC127639463 n=1 Tax=Xyrauchen texanus TaxID=154827 RepID=UPI002242061C|nr:uncharacterized protein LOC127639463 [Xyrauchen texanus]
MMKKYWDHGPEIDKAAGKNNNDRKFSNPRADLRAESDRVGSVTQSVSQPEEKDKTFSHTAPPPSYERLPSPLACVPVKNKLYPDLKTASAFPFVETSEGFKVHPLPLADVIAIAKELPDPSKTPHQYVSVLKRLTAYSQLTGRDYRFILTKTLPPEITEEELIEEIDLLSPTYDTPSPRNILTRHAAEPVDLSRTFRNVRIVEDHDDHDVDWVWANSEGPTHPFVPGQSVLIRCLKPTKLGEPNYLGPATVIAVTRTGVLTDLQPQWIHASRVKLAPEEGLTDSR